MKSFRIGTDRVITWHIFSEEGKEYDLSDKKLTLSVSTSHSVFTVPEDQFSVVGGVLTWNFEGRQQKTLGPHSLTLTINEGEPNMVSIDKCDAFTLVKCSCQEKGVTDEDIEVSGIELITTMSAIGLYPLPFPVTVIDLAKKDDVEYVKEVAEKLKNLSRFVLVIENNARHYAGNSVILHGTYADVIHYEDKDNALIKHVHKFYDSGQYKRYTATYNFEDTAAIEALQKEVAELKDKLAQIIIETDE